MPNNDFRTFSQLHKPAVDARLQASLQGIMASNTATADVRHELVSLGGRGGKRLRPLLCLLAYEAYGGSNWDAALDASVSLELLHTFLLIHDDIIDRDCHRWGGLNITGVYFEKFSQYMEPREALHMAESWALLAGDMCFNQAYATLAASNFPAHSKAQAISLLQTITMAVIGGELADTANSFMAGATTEAAILAMYEQKTASYSFVLPMQMGALLANAAQAEPKLLNQIGNHLGVAYQLQDDLLGIYGDEAKTGKPTGNDLREAKRTVLITKTLELTKAADKKVIQAALGASTLEPLKLQKAQTIIRQCGAEQYTLELAKYHSQKALLLVNETNMDQLSKKRLTSLIKELTKRER